ncbi:unnamed protein product [Rangifer tarandus platyrhynchus]|uniref:Uncharacterized protein n=1 Tax=Rangifer tarandus platyrhynchus TaxID=3082113 RepID=A0AC59YJV8_RANTA
MLSPSLCGPGGPQHPHPEDLSPRSKQLGPWPGWMARRWAVQETADRFPWGRGPTAMNTSGSFASPKANSLLSESCLEHGRTSPLSRVHLPPPPPSASSSSWAQALMFQNSLGATATFNSSAPGPVNRAKSLPLSDPGARAPHPGPAVGRRAVGLSGWDFLPSYAAGCFRHLLCFLASLLQSVVFPGNPGSFSWIMLREGNIWAQDVFAATGESLLLGPPSPRNEESVGFYYLVCVRINTKLYM